MVYVVKLRHVTYALFSFFLAFSCTPSNEEGAAGNQELKTASEDSTVMQPHHYLHYYLNHPGVPESAKDFHRGKMLPQDSLAVFSIIDSLFSENADLQPFYFMTVSEILSMPHERAYLASTAASFNYITQRTKQFFLHFSEENLLTNRPRYFENWTAFMVGATAAGEKGNHLQAFAKFGDRLRASCAHCNLEALEKLDEFITTGKSMISGEYYEIRKKGKGKITIAAAANTQYVTDELMALFKEKTGIEVERVLGSSGKLTAQIKNGAPYDIFISANMKYPDYLFGEGIVPEKPVVYAKGALVLWTMSELEFESGLKALVKDEVEKVAIANPKTAPYGQIAVKALEKSGVYGDILHKLVYGNNIAQVNQYVTLETVEAGLTAKSVVLSPEMAGKGKWVEIPGATIEQGLVKLKHGMEKNRENTNRFHDFLLSVEAKKVLGKYGYLSD